MPFVNFIYSSAIQKDAEISSALTQIINEKLGKPIDYICVNVVYNPSLFFAGTNAPSAMVQIQAVGGSLDVVIAPITDAATRILNIQGDRIFVNYELFTRNNWGMNGATF